MDKYLKKKEPEQSDKKNVAALVTQEIYRLVSNIEYESAGIVIYDLKIVQIEYREKARFNENGVMRRKLSRCC